MSDDRLPGQRDPQRIDRVLAKLREIWLSNPDLRLCQIIGNALPGDGDKYFVEDDALEAALDGYPRVTDWTFPLQVDPSIPPGELLVIPALKRKPGETDAEFQRRRVEGTVRLTNVGSKK